MPGEDQARIDPAASFWRESPATVMLVVATLAVSVLILMEDALPVAALQLGFIPARVGVGIGGGWWLPWPATPLSATLVHGGWGHLLFNLVMLGFCGRDVERALDGRGVAMLYLAGAFASAAGQWIAQPGSAVPMIGASGAISAIVGAYALFFGERRAKAIGPVPAGIVHAAWLAAGWIGVQLLLGAAEPAGMSIAIAAHIGGFLAGLALAPLLLRRRLRADRSIAGRSPPAVTP